MPKTGSTAVVDDTEEPVYNVHPYDNIYSYFMFISPTEKKKHSAYSTDVLMAFLLVFMNIFFQFMLIYTIFNEVVIDNFEWQNGIMKTSNALNLIDDSQSFGMAWGEKCNDGASLCFAKDGVISCAPPSVQLMGRWDDLDSNGDGIWTRDEVMSKREELKCQYAVDPLEVFDVLHKFLRQRESLIWLHPEVTAGKVIHEAYFTYAKGDIIMCGYRNQETCPNLLERGFFDAPLKYGTAPRVGKTIDSALGYCQELLKPGGLCERILPSTYSVWKIDSAQQCKEMEFEKFTYKHPNGDDFKSLLKVDYDARENFERSKTLKFMSFKGIIIFLWLLAICQEVKQIIIVMTWVFRFPNAESFGEDAVQEIPDPTTLEPDSVAYIIKGITTPHRISVGLLVFIRFSMIMVLAFVGVSFLSKQTDYIDLLLDGVALVFILEIAQLIYVQVLRDEIRHQTEAITPMTVPMWGLNFLNRRPALTDVVWLLAIFLVVLVVMFSFYVNISVPVSQALECTCLVEGETCFEADTFSKDFWKKYWLDDVPAVYKKVDNMKSGVAATAAADAPSSSPSPAVALLHHYSSHQHHQHHQTRHHHLVY